MFCISSWMRDSLQSTRRIVSHLKVMHLLFRDTSAADEMGLQWNIKEANVNLLFVL